MTRKRELFLGAGDSARSQMAEARSIAASIPSSP